MVPSSLSYVDVFMEDENACEVVWAVHLNKILVTGFAISRPTRNFQSWEWFKIALEEQGLYEVLTSLSFIFS